MAVKDEEVKIGSPEEAFWKKILDDSKSQIEQLKNQMKFAEAVSEISEKKMKENAL